MILTYLQSSILQHHEHSLKVLRYILFQFFLDFFLS